MWTALSPKRFDDLTPEQREQEWRSLQEMGKRIEHKLKLDTSQHLIAEQEAKRTVQ